MDFPSNHSIIQNFQKQAEELCQIHDHATRVIANLDLNENWFANYKEPGKANLDLNADVLAFLYTAVHSPTPHTYRRTYVKRVGGLIVERSERGITKVVQGAL